MRISELKRRIPITVFLSRHVQVPSKPSLSGWTPINCPFHRDSNPSAAFNVRKDRFTCHACGVRGDVIDLAQVVLTNSDNPEPTKSEAIKWLQERFIQSTTTT